jgi:hypothetical protein
LIFDRLFKTFPDYALCSAVIIRYKTGTRVCFCGVSDGAQQGAVPKGPQ